VETYIPPGPLERVMIRSSALYRYIKFSEHSPLRTPSVAYDELKSQSHPELCRNEDPLWIFRRNTEVVVTHALAKGAVPVLTTQPRHPPRAREEDGQDEHFSRCNELVTQIHEEYRTTTLFVDLDRTMTGPHRHFRDTAHCTPQGLEMKAEQIGEAILAHRREALILPASPPADDGGSHVPDTH